MENRRSSRTYSGGKGSSAGGGRFSKRPGFGPKDERTGPRSPGDERGFWNKGGEHGRSDGRGGPRFGRKSDSRTSRPQNDGRPRGKASPQPADLPKITSDLQLTDGRFRAQKLTNSLSPAAVPTPRKLREVLFKVISRRVKARRFMDLGCGCGTVGLEAISRGAMIVTFVERSAKIRSFLEKNVGILGLKPGHAEIAVSEVVPFLKNAEKRRRRWDLVFLGTCSEESELEIFRYIGRGVPVVPGGLFLIEHDAERELPEALGILRRWRVIKNESGAITIYERP